MAVDAESGALTDLSPGWNRVFSTVMDPGFDVSADGKWIAMAINATPPPYRERTNLDIYVIPTDGTGALKDLTSSNPYTDDSPRFAPDGRSIYYVREAKYTAGNRRIARVDVSSGASATLTGRLRPLVRRGLVHGRRKDAPHDLRGPGDRRSLPARRGRDGPRARLRRGHHRRARGAERLGPVPERSRRTARPRSMPSTCRRARRGASRASTIPCSRRSISGGPSRGSSGARAGIPCRCS